MDRHLEYSSVIYAKTDVGVGIWVAYIKEPSEKAIQMTYHLLFCELPMYFIAQVSRLCLKK